MTPAAFAARRRGATTTEKAATQSRLLDVCPQMGEPGLMEAGPTGQDHAFEKRVEKAGDGSSTAPDPGDLRSLIPGESLHPTSHQRAAT